MKKWLTRLFGIAKSQSEPPAMTSPTVPLFARAPLALPAEGGGIDVDAMFYPWLLGIDADAESELNDTEKRFLRALERLSAADGAAVTDLVPRMPAVIPLLLQSLRDKNMSNAQLSDQISQDAVLVAAVLRQVNSSWYRRTSTITSIEQALAILGQNGLRLLVASVAFKPVLTAQSGHFTTPAAPHIWDLSGKCAIACRCLAVQRHIDPFEPFLAALTQHVGLLVALRIMDQVHDGNGSPKSAAFCALLAHHARMLSCRVGRHWNFPEAVTAALAEVRTGPAAGSAIGDVLYLGDRLSKLRVLVNNDRLPETDAESCIAGEELQGCYRELGDGKTGDARHPDE